MLDKIKDFTFDHPILASILGVIIGYLFLTLFITGLCSCVLGTPSSGPEDIKDAQYVLYTADGEMKALEYSSIIDMDTGYQYRIFEIDGQYVCAPAIDEDGTVYKTVE